MTDTPKLLFERDGAIARIVLNRPDAGNAVDLELGRAFLDAAIECDEDDRIRCVVLAANGRMFCVGGDISAFAGAGDRVGVLLKQLTGLAHSAIARLARMNKPLLTVVNGPAAGIGLGLAVLGDIVLAARSAHFTAAYTAIGVTPDGGITWMLPRLIGVRRAQEMLLLNKRVGAEEATAIGLITRAVDDDALADEAAKLAQTLARSATSALARTRNLLLDGLEAGFEGQMEAESRSIAAAGGSAEGREGIRAFLEKRRPNFQQ